MKKEQARKKFREKTQEGDFKEKKWIKRKERERHLFQRQLLHRPAFPIQQH